MHRLRVVTILCYSYWGVQLTTIRVIHCYKGWEYSALLQILSICTICTWLLSHHRQCNSGAAAGKINTDNRKENPRKSLYRYIYLVELLCVAALGSVDIGRCDAGSKQQYCCANSMCLRVALEVLPLQARLQYWGACSICFQQFCWLIPWSPQTHTHTKTVKKSINSHHITLLFLFTFFLLQSPHQGARQVISHMQ